MHPGPLAGLCIVEYSTSIAAAAAGKILADLGAEVLKIEPPAAGDPIRHHGPFPGDVPHPERSGLFLHLNTSKRGLTLDLARPTGRDLLHGLLAEADVFLHNWVPAEAEVLDLSEERVRQRHPRLIVAAVTPYGSSGPYANYRGADITACAAGGVSVGTGFPERAPLTLPLSLGGHFSGVAAAAAILLAHFGRKVTGQGQFVDVSETDVLATLLAGYGIPTYIYRGVTGIRAGRHMSLGLYPNAVFECRDGFVCIDCPQLAQWHRLLELMGNPSWMHDPRYRDRRHITEQYPQEVDALLAPWLMARDKATIFAETQAQRIPSGPVNTFKEAIEDAHLRHRGYFVTVAREDTGPLTYPGAPYRLSKTPWAIRRPAPHLGEHNDEILGGRLGVSREELGLLGQTGVIEATPVSVQGTRPKNTYPHELRPAHEGHPSADALAGYRVLDFGTAFASPMAAHLLADMGAEVIKIESRTRLDGLRLGRPIVGEDIAGGDRGEWPEYQPVFHGLNRSKLGITVNIKHPEGITLLKRLVRLSDVVIHNFSPGVMDRAGLGYAALCAEKPDLIYVSLPAAGESGPLRDIVTYAPVIAALSGLSALVGYSAAGEDFVGTLQVAFCDAVGALNAVVAILAALHHRQMTGEGQAIEISQWEASLAMLGEGVLDYVMNGRVLSPVGNAHPRMVPHDNYRCAGDDAWVAIAVASEAEWRAFCQTTGHAEWADDPRFADAYRRRRHSAELDVLITTWTGQRTPYEVMEILQAAGVAAMPVMNLEDQFRDPHLRARDIHLESEHPKVGLEFLHGIPWRLSDTPGRIRRPAPLLGEHNQYVFGELLGLPDAEIQRLVEAGAIY